MDDRVLHSLAYISHLEDQLSILRHHHRNCFYSGGSRFTPPLDNCPQLERELPHLPPLQLPPPQSPRCIPPPQSPHPRPPQSSHRFPPPQSPHPPPLPQSSHRFPTLQSPPPLQSPRCIHPPQSPHPPPLPQSSHRFPTLQSPPPLQSPRCIHPPQSPHPPPPQSSHRFPPPQSPHPPPLPQSSHRFPTLQSPPPPQSPRCIPPPQSPHPPPPLPQSPHSPPLRPPRVPRKATWHSLSDELILHIPHKKDLEELYGRNHNCKSRIRSILRGISIPDASILDEPLARDPLEILRNYSILTKGSEDLAKAAGEVHAFQELVFVSACEVLTSNGHDVSSINELMRLCISNSADTNLYRIRKGSRWLGNLISLRDAAWEHLVTEYIFSCALSVSKYSILGNSANSMPYVLVRLHPEEGTGPALGNMDVDVNKQGQIGEPDVGKQGGPDVGRQGQVGGPDVGDKTEPTDPTNFRYIPLCIPAFVKVLLGDNYSLVDICKALDYDDSYITDKMESLCAEYTAIRDAPHQGPVLTSLEPPKLEIKDSKRRRRKRQTEDDLNSKKRSKHSNHTVPDSPSVEEGAAENNRASPEDLETNGHSLENIVFVENVQAGSLLEAAATETPHYPPTIDDLHLGQTILPQLSQTLSWERELSLPLGWEQELPLGWEQELPLSWEQEPISMPISDQIPIQPERTPSASPSLDTAGLNPSNAQEGSTNTNRHGLDVPTTNSTSNLNWDRDFNFLISELSPDWHGCHHGPSWPAAPSATP